MYVTDDKGQRSLAFVPPRLFGVQTQGTYYKQHFTGGSSIVKLWEHNMVIKGSAVFVQIFIQEFKNHALPRFVSHYTPCYMWRRLVYRCRQRHVLPPLHPANDIRSSAPVFSPWRSPSLDEAVCVKWRMVLSATLV